MNKLYLVIFLLSSLFLVGCQSSYEKGVDLLKEKKYELALDKFKDVNQNDDNYSHSLSKINYIIGLKYYEEGDFDKALSSLSGVSNKDEYKKSADSLILLVNQSPKYLYQHGQIEFELGKYYFAYDNFSKIPKTSEEYKLCISKLILCQAFILKKEDKLDSAKLLLQNISEHDSIYDKVLIEIKSIKRKEDFLKAKEYYKDKKYNNSLELLNNVDKNEDYYNESINLIKLIEEIQELDKYETIKTVNFYNGKGATALTLNNKRFNIEMKYEGVYSAKSLCDKLFKEEFKISKLSFGDDGEINFRFEDNKKVGVSKIQIDTDLPNLGLSYHGEAVKIFYLDFDKVSATISDDNLVNQIKNDKNKYKICLIYKICEATVVAESTWTDNWYLEAELVKYYIVDDNNNIILQKTI